MESIDKKNLFWNSLSFIFTSLLAFLNFTLTLKTYDTVLLGFYLLLGSYWGIGASLDMGFGISTVKNIAEATKVGDEIRLKKIVNTFLLTYIVFGIVISLVTLCIYYLIASNSVLPSGELLYNVNVLIILMAVAFLLKYIVGFFVTVYEGLAKFIIVSKINIIIGIFNTAMIIIIFIFKMSLYYLAISQCIYGLMLLTVLILLLPSQRENIEFSPRYFDAGILRMQTSYNLNIQLSFLLTSLLDPIMKSILSFSIGLQFVTYFETAKKIINLSNGLIYSALKGMFNKISEANSVGELKKYVNENIFYFSNLSLDYSVLVYGIMNPLLCLFILYWFKTYETLIIFLIFLLPYSIINYAGPLYSVLMVEGKGGRLVILQSINVVLVSIMLYLGITMFSSYIGILGFYAATIINMYFVFLFLRKYIGFDPDLFFNRSNYSSIIILNIVLIVQLTLSLIYPENLNYLLILFSILYNIVFMRQLKYYIKYFRNLFGNFLNSILFKKRRKG